MRDICPAVLGPHHSLISVYSVGFREEGCAVSHLGKKWALKIPTFPGTVLVCGWSPQLNANLNKGKGGIV